MQSYIVPLVSLACVSLVMIVVWIWAYRIKNAGVVDIFWAFNFTVIAVVIWFMAEGYDARVKIVCILSGLWSLRLGIYLFKRVGSHLDVEEGRYKQLREEWAPNANRTFFIFFQAQALSNVFLAIPFFITATNTNVPLNTLGLACGLFQL